MPESAPRVGRLTPSELRGRLDAGSPTVLLDVREPSERDYCSIPAPPGVADLHVPLGHVPARLDSIAEAARSGRLVVYCHHGVRSLMAARWLAAQGIEVVENLEGGIDAWSAQVDPGVPRY